MKQETANHLLKKPLKYRTVEAITPHNNEADAVDGTKLFTINLHELDVYNLLLHTLVSKDGLDELFESIRKGVELMEIEK